MRKTMMLLHCRRFVLFTAHSSTNFSLRATCVYGYSEALFTISWYWRSNGFTVTLHSQTKGVRQLTLHAQFVSCETLPKKENKKKEKKE